MEKLNKAVEDKDLAEVNFIFFSLSLCWQNISSTGTFKRSHNWIIFYGDSVGRPPDLKPRSIKVNFSVTQASNELHFKGEEELIELRVMISTFI